MGVICSNTSTIKNVIYMDPNNDGEKTGNQVLLTFLPRHIRSKIFNFKDLKPSASPFRGTVLMIDISGFTSLTERFSKSKKNLEKEESGGGEEIMRGTVNNYFGKLINVVVEWGGFVSKFAGDALVCFFPKTKEKESLEDVVERTLFCCGIIIEDFGSNVVKVMGSVIELYVHLGIGVGKFETILVGNENRMDWVDSGGAIEVLKDTMALGKRREILASEKVVKLIKSKKIDIIKVKKGTYKISKIPRKKPNKNLIKTFNSKPSQPETSMKVFFDQYFIKRANNLDSLNEIKDVSIVFVDAKDRHDFEQINKIYRRIKMIENHFDGNLINFLLDEKGLIFVLVFGYPRTHENDPLRAASAALEILQLGNLTIGLTTGRCFLGLFGNKTRRNVNILGSSVNLASRLTKSSKNGNQILVCEKTLSLLQYEFNFGESGLIVGKGVKRGEKYYVLEGKVHNTFNICRKNIEENEMCFGRDSEMTEIKSTMDEFLSKESSQIRTFGLQGEMGNGKTLILKQVLPLFGSTKTILFTGEEIEKRSPYFVFRKFFQQLFKETGESLCIENFKSFLYLLNPYFYTNFQKNSFVDGFFIGRGSKKRKIQEILLNVIINWLNMQNQPTVFVFENYQWFDVKSRDLIHRVIHSFGIQTKTIFIFTSREKIDLPIEKSIILENFSFSHTKNFIIWLLQRKCVESSSIDIDVSKLIHKKSMGNGKLISDLLDHLINNGELIEINKNLKFKDSFLAKEKELSFESLFGSMINSKLDKLDIEVKELCKILAVCSNGVRIHLDLAKEFFNNNDSFIRSLNALEKENLISRDDNGERNFLNSEIISTILGIMTREKKSTLHFEAAKYFSEIDKTQEAKHLYEGINNTIERSVSDEVLEQTASKLFKVGENEMLQERYINAFQMFERCKKLLQIISKKNDHQKRMERDACVKAAISIRYEFENEKEIIDLFEHANLVWKEKDNVYFQILYGIWHYKFLQRKGFLEAAVNFLNESKKFSDPVIILHAHKAVAISYNLVSDQEKTEEHVSAGLGIFRNLTNAQLNQKLMNNEFQFGGMNPIVHLLMISGRMNWLICNFGSFKKNFSEADSIINMNEFKENDIRTTVLYLTYKIRTFAEKREMSRSELNGAIKFIKKQENSRFLRRIEFELNSYIGYIEYINGKKEAGMEKMKSNILSLEASGNAHPIVKILWYEALINEEKDLNEVEERLKRDISEEKYLLPELFKLYGLLLSKQEENNVDQKKIRNKIEEYFFKAINFAKRGNMKIYELRSWVELTKFRTSTKQKRKESLRNLELLLNSFCDNEDNEIKRANNLLNDLKKIKMNKKDDYLSFKSFSSDSMTKIMQMMVPLKNELLSMKDEIEGHALKEGDKIPHFLFVKDGRDVSTKDLLKDGPLVISFYRGSWCPFCSAELCMLDDNIIRFHEFGANLLSVTPDHHAIDEAEKEDLAVDIVIDDGNNIARSFGLVYKAGKVTKNFYKMMNFDLSYFNQNNDMELPIPATYVVNEEGFITKSFVQMEYYYRMEADEIVEELQKLDIIKKKKSSDNSIDYFSFFD